MIKYVGYFRVSTTKQGNSGLGLEAQRISVNNFIGNNSLVAEFIEIESGKNDKREKLLSALAYCKENDCTLLIAKLDRLSRNASFIFKLKDAGIKFIAVDMPDATNFTIGIFALLAQQEREFISERTKKALAVRKAQGVKLGKPENLTDVSRQRSIEARKERATQDDNNKKALALINSMRQQSISYNKIADSLNRNGFQTRRSNKFHAMSVKQLYSAQHI